jgi:probable HAF family extracellular repeat protein
MKLNMRLILPVLGLLICGKQARADAFLLNNGVFTTINVPGANSGTTVAEGINDSGQIVGFFNTGSIRHGFLDTNGVFSAIDFPGATFTEASGINSTGQIVGLFATSGGAPQAFLDANGVFSMIDGPDSGAGGINSAGDIVGSNMTLAIEHPFIDIGGNITVITLPFSNVLFSEGHSINDSRNVVGVYFTPSTPGAHGFLDSSGVFSAIDVPGASGTYSYGINNSGQIVGFFSEQVGSQQVSHGYEDTNGVFTTIDVPGGVDTVANGINDAGEIVGAFSNPASSPTPEPGSLPLVLCGLAALVGMIKLKATI